ncbi:30S ribosomal protein THX [Chryseobacterium indologenes]|nr:30S ribosomal protein THX [Chryseobacterium indologenes]ATN06766.1 30S ribosomal protein THX [Chryseobacterium indologenes]AYY84488.1 30S ribosomal protein THX [Chryseobacterium indologenes]QIX81444.1 30S ribosomal protein THX [Chryseobacterium indologenes]QPQ52781.1 30S ribosomal protein THX [Chryseobacterium indologenes]TLX25749.1 30S ribosomal protein THX [Chryseobacterium indologenes]
MGKGDKKSRRGKINAGSYGKRRPRKSSKSFAVSEEKSKK